MQEGLPIRWKRRCCSFIMSCNMSEPSSPSSLLYGPLAPALLRERATPHQIRTCERPLLGWRWMWNRKGQESVDGLDSYLNRRGNTELIWLHKKPLNLRNVSALIRSTIHVQLSRGRIHRYTHLWLWKLTVWHRGAAGTGTHEIENKDKCADWYLWGSHI